MRPATVAAGDGFIVDLANGVHNVTSTSASGITVYRASSGQGGQLTFSVSIVGGATEGYATPWIYIYSGPTAPTASDTPALTSTTLQLSYVLDPCYFSNGGTWYFGVVTLSSDKGNYQLQLPRAVDVVCTYAVRTHVPAGCFC